MGYRKLFFIILSSLLFLVSSTTLSKTITATRLGMVPYDEAYADYNANKLAAAFNQGYKVKINSLYYLGTAEENIVNDINIKGSGTLVLSSVQCFIAASPISITLNGITLSTSKPITSETQVKFITNQGHNYHDKICVKKCHLSGIRLYTHVADDVDNITIKDGVRIFEFENNCVENVGYYLVRLDNCLCETATIKRNRISAFRSIVFGFGVSNEYTHTDLPRLKELYIHDNYIDNSGLIPDENYTYSYLTPIIAEAQNIECLNNKITNILADSKDVPVAVYPFYLSGNNVIINGNYICDCLNISNSEYNEIFKCKSAFKGAKGNREIIGNTVIVTDSSLQVRKQKEVPYIRMLGLQHDYWDTVLVEDNNINLACDFVFGAGFRAEYQKFIFKNNIITYRSLGPKAHSLIRLNASKNQRGTISIIGNQMYPQTRPLECYGLYLYDCTGYSIRVRNNILSGFTPYGMSFTNYYIEQSISENNVIDVGFTTVPIRIAVNIGINDTIISEGLHSIIFYPDNWSHSVIMNFSEMVPTSILIGNKYIDKRDIQPKFKCDF